MKSLKHNATVILCIFGIGSACLTGIVWAADQRYMQISVYKAINNEQRLMSLDDKLEELRLKIKFNPPSKVNEALFDKYTADREKLYRKINGGDM